VVDTVGLKIMGSRSPSVAWPLYSVSLKSTNWCRSY